MRRAVLRVSRPSIARVASPAAAPALRPLSSLVPTGRPSPSPARSTRGNLGVFTVIAGASAFLLWNQAAASEKKEAIPSLQMDPQNWGEYELISKTVVSPNTAIYRFKLPNPEESLHMPVASYILAKADLGEEKPVVRPYTPITYEEKGYFELLVKSYPEGKLSKHFASLKAGDKLSFKGPNPKIEYKPNMKKTISMIAGGSGITPMLQVIQEILKNPADKTEIRLIFANVTKDDILLKERIDGWAQKHSNFKVIYTLDKPPAGWTGETGFVSEAMVKKHLPPPSNDTLVLVCGPPGMMKAVSGPKTPDYQQGEVDGVLKAIGYSKDQVFKF